MGRLAIKGGEVFRKEPYPSWPYFTDEETESVVEVVKSGKWWRFAYGEGVELKEKSFGEDRSKVVLFQEEFAKYQEAAFGLACANGTAAIEVVLKALGIGPGDEVIVPSYTYVGTATAVLQVNAIPVFADVDPDTYNIDPQRVREVITDRTKAIIPVHFSGQPADMDAILDIARENDLYVIEDAAHAHGARWREKKVGALGDAGTFSFQASKNMTSGEGGAILTNNRKLASLCDSYIWAGREVGRPWYEFHRLGWNYRLTEFQGAILRIQLKRLDEQIDKRNENAAYLTKELEKIEGLKPLKVDERVSRHSYHIYMVKYDEDVFGINKEIFMDALLAEGIAVFKGYTFPLYKNPMFLNKDFYPKGCPINCHHYGKDIDFAAYEAANPVSEKACSKEAVWFDQRMLLGDKKGMDDIIGAIKKIKDNLNELR